MQRLIAGGTGLVGQYLVKHWLNQKINITVLGRDKHKISHCFGTSVNIMDWDDFERLPNHDLKSFDSIVNLCGTNIGEKRWSSKRKQLIFDSRIKTTQTIVDKMIPLADQAPKLFNTSAIGVYGLQPTNHQHLPAAFDEDSQIDFHARPDFLATVARAWELATAPAKAHGIHVNNMRFGVVLTPQGGALEKLALPIKLGFGGKIGSGDQAFSWIHIKDLLNIFDFLHQHTELHGVINCVAPECVTQLHLVNTIAKKLHRPALMPLPSFMVKLMFGEMGDELLLRGQHVYPKRLLENNFHFEFATIEKAVGDLV